MLLADEDVDRLDCPSTPGQGACHRGTGTTEHVEGHGPLDIGVLRGDADAAVEQLHLCGRGLGPLSAQLIGGLLRTNRTLRSLDLSRNAIGNEGACALLNALRAQPAPGLTSLDLRDNGRIRGTTAKALGGLVALTI